MLPLFAKRVASKLFFALPLIIRVFAIISSVFIAPSLFANELNLANYKGKVVYVDFWASWCGPCRQSFPWMKKLHSEKHAEGLVIIAVNVDQEKNLADDFLAQFSPEFKVLFDTNGKIAREFDVTAMPTSYLIDRNGKQRFKHQGFRNEKREQYEQEIEDLLKEKMD